MSGHDVELTRDACLLQVAVCELPLGVVLGDDLPLDVGRELLSPEVRLALVTEEHPPHARQGSVIGAQVGGFLRDDLREARGALLQAMN